MDSHYKIVMNARAAVKDTGLRLYFGYSGVLDRAAFEEWRRQHGYDFFTLPDGVIAEAPNVDLVFDFPSRWWGGRVAGLADKPDASVFGRLYEIAAADWPVIQHKEGVVTGMAVERAVRVRVNGTEVEATTFVTSPNRQSLDGPVSERYMKALVNGATQAGLPAAYIDSLRSKAV